MRKLHTTSLILIIVFYTSCAVLPPSGPNVPLFKEKGEAMVSASVIGSTSAPLINIQGIEIKGAMATGEHFYMGGSGAAFLTGGKIYSFMSELGVGMFGNVGNNGIYDVSGGLGYGSSSGTRFTKICIQPAFGLRFEKVELAIGMKGSYVISKPDKMVWDIYEEKPKDLIVEPFMLGRFGGKNTKFQLGLNFPLTIAGDFFAIPQWSYTAGVVFRLGKNRGMSK